MKTSKARFFLGAVFLSISFCQIVIYRNLKMPPLVDALTFFLWLSGLLVLPTALIGEAFRGDQRWKWFTLALLSSLVVNYCAFGIWLFNSIKTGSV